MIDPIALQLGPISIHWYGLAYVVGIVGAWQYILTLLPRFPGIERRHIDDFIPWIVGGIIVGGRLGYVLFYKPDYYLHHPLEILMTWHGGMAFHGGFLGCLMATLIYTHRHQINIWQLGDLIACGAPIGIFFGRIANFINGELYGNTTTAPWGVVFPGGGPLPRHPSQLYEAFLEGFVLWAILVYATRKTAAASYPGKLLSLFLIGYGVFRFLVEFVRKPDDFLGYLWGHMTTGQWLSIPLIAGGVIIFWWRCKKCRTNILKK